MQLREDTIVEKGTSGVSLARMAYADNLEGAVNEQIKYALECQGAVLYALLSDQVQLPCHGTLLPCAKGPSTLCGTAFSGKTVNHTRLEEMTSS